MTPPETKSEKVVRKSRPFSRQKIVFPTQQDLKLADLINGYCRNRSIIRRLWSEMRLENADVPDLCVTFPDAAGVSSTLFLNQNANTKVQGNWIFSKI